MSNQQCTIMEATAEKTAKTLKSITLEQFKAQEKITKLDIFRSRAGNLYACNEAGEFIGMLSNDFDRSKPVLVHYMVNTSTAETWTFIANGEPKAPEFSL